MEGGLVIKFKHVSVLENVTPITDSPKGGC